MRCTRLAFCLVLLATAPGGLCGCAPEIRDGQLVCDPASPRPCPPGMLCARYGNEHRCFHPGAWRCGNGELEALEECDGNDFGGLSCADFGGRPGAALRCSSTCVAICCGNGRVEGSGETGEPCDDGNDRSHDGCSSSCTVEAPEWQVYDGGWQRGRSDHRMVYFPPRSAVLLVGGRSTLTDPQVTFGDTWEYDGETWRHLALDTAPPPRSQHALVYDSARERLVLFGGLDAEGEALGDTWEFDGQSWSAIAAPGPAPRYAHAMAYDSRRAVTVLVGGVEDIGQVRFHTDTWEYDGGAWRERTSEVGETPPVMGHTLTYDAARRESVLIGGDVSLGELSIGRLETLWRYAGSTWTDSGVAVTLRGAPIAAYDEDRRRVVVMGAAGTGGDIGQFYTWDGTALDTHHIYADLEGRAGAALAYDPSRHNLVLFGGGALDSGMHLQALIDTWEHDGFGWFETTPVQGPVITTPSLAAAFDPLRQRLIVVTGREPAETWAFVGSDLGWQPLDIPGPPGDLRGASLVYDPGADRFLLFGATSAQTGRSNETWSFDGGAWAPLPLADLPPVIGSASLLVYDEGRGRALLVATESERSPEGAWVASTYALEGDRWEQLDRGALPIVSPQNPDPSAALTYDPSRGAPLLVGCVFETGAACATARTWTHDGATWTPLPVPETPAFSPAIRGALTFDRAVHRPLLLLRAPTAAVQTWELREEQWVEISPAAGPPSLSAPPYLFYDGSRQASLLIRPLGGTTPTPSDWTFEIWEFRYDSPAPTERCEVPGDEDGDGREGCDDPDCADHPACR